ncbi:Yvc1 protein [Maudiozyma humilis]|uniref:Yvc1 protein n=1 Tax=Maudiozyma humilis TaxID=51915 RepID=A0AAV5RZ56_MAUHU|nr:Yvc1 protein [Kazachstania humilis]
MVGSVALPYSNSCGFYNGEREPEGSTPSPRQVLRIAINLKYLIDRLVTEEVCEEDVMKEDGAVVDGKFLKLAYTACGGDQDDPRSHRKYQAVLLYALLNVSSWYQGIKEADLQQARISETRALVAQRLCQMVIDKEEKRDLHFLFGHMLLRRYSIYELDDESEAANVVELATDLHFTAVVSTGGYQRCLRWLWIGWITQCPGDPNQYIIDRVVASTEIWDHFTPGRIRTPAYQNVLNIVFSLVFLLLYTIVVNGNDTGHVEPLNKWEYVFYIFTYGNVLDELIKFYYIGYAYFQFWNCFNDTLYILIMASMVFRVASVCSSASSATVESYDLLSYRLLSCASPLAWSRLLLYLESQKFIGIMIIVVKHMMKESFIFFFLLILLLLGFLQGFIGLDLSDGELDITWPIVSNLLATIIGNGDFSVFEHFASPYAGILFYCYSFIISVILLNILIALYANAYQQVVDNADDEYMCLMSQKTLRFIRAPDEDVYVPPLNVIEVVMYPLLFLLPPGYRSAVKTGVMTVMYSPMLLVCSILEVREARRIKYNRLRGMPDDSNQTDSIWDLTDGYVEDAKNIILNRENIGIRATELKNNRSLAIQRREENNDPTFSVSNAWYLAIEKREGKKGDKEADLAAVVAKQSTQIERLSTQVEELTALVKKLALKEEE